MTTETGRLVEDFERYFNVEFANTESLKNEVYRVRYRVYCEEFQYEATDHFPEGLEKDEYDDISMHCLITHRTSGLAAGCVRLVPTAGDPSGLLPMEKHCRESIDQQFIDNLHLERSKECELSRLAVDQNFRRRPGETATRFGELSSLDMPINERRTFPLIAVSAFVAAIALTDLSGRNSVFAMMEPFLPRLLKRSGICFVRAGQDTDYHGLRAPYYLDAQAAETVNDELKPLYHWIRNQLKLGFDKSQVSLA